MGDGSPGVARIPSATVRPITTVRTPMPTTRVQRGVITQPTQMAECPTQRQLDHLRRTGTDCTTWRATYSSGAGSGIQILWARTASSVAATGPIATPTTAALRTARNISRTWALRSADSVVCESRISCPPVWWPTIPSTAMPTTRVGTAATAWCSGPRMVRVVWARHQRRTRLTVMTTKSRSVRPWRRT